MEGTYGQANAVANYLGKDKGKWVAVPSSWGTQNKGPVARISLWKEHAGIDVTKMYPGVGGTIDDAAWNMDTMLKAAEALHKAGKPVGICGEMAGDPGTAILLMAMGFDSLSMSASNLLKIRKTICNVPLMQARGLLEQVMQVDHPFIRNFFGAGRMQPAFSRTGG